MQVSEVVIVSGHNCGMELGIEMKWETSYTICIIITFSFRDFNWSDKEEIRKLLRTKLHPALILFS